MPAGDKSIQQANERRFEDRVQQLFQQYKEQRMTSAALECEELINKASSRLTVVGTPDPGVQLTCVRKGCCSFLSCHAMMPSSATKVSYSDYDCQPVELSAICTCSCMLDSAACGALNLIQGCTC